MSGEIKVEVGKSYMVSNYWKKTVHEVESWVSEDNRKVVCVETRWRGGSFIITPQHEGEAEELQHHYDKREDSMFEEVLEITDFEEYEFDSTFDGVSEYLTFTGAHKWSEAEEEEITENYYEEWTSYLEEDLNLSSEGCEISIIGGIEIEEYTREE